MRFLLLTLLLGSTHTAAADPCTELIPAALAAAIEQSFPKYRAPLASDNETKDIDSAARAGANRCLGVATADFDGDTKKDYLLALTARDGRDGQVVVALTRGATWQIETLSLWPNERNRLFVTVEKPGVYDRTESQNAPLALGEREHLRCRNPVAVLGAIDASGVVFCRNKNVWEHVWISE